MVFASKHDLTKCRNEQRDLVYCRTNQCCYLNRSSKALRPFKSSFHARWKGCELSYYSSQPGCHEGHCSRQAAQIIFNHSTSPLAVAAKYGSSHKMVSPITCCRVRVDISSRPMTHSMACDDLSMAIFNYRRRGYGEQNYLCFDSVLNRY